MRTFYERVRHATATMGVGTVTLGTASTGYQSFTEAGVANGAVVTYCIEDGNNFELGRGVYSTGAQTLTRAQILVSKIDGSAADTSPLSLSGSATLFLTASAGDLIDIRQTFSVTRFGAVGDGSTDDTAAFLAAAAAANASSDVKTVYVPHKGSGYVLSAPVILYEGVTWIGDNVRGGQLSRIKPASGYSGALFETDDYGNSRKLRVGMKGLYLDGSSTTLTAIQVNCQESLFQNLTIKNCFTYGLHLGGVGSGATEQALNNHIVDNFLAGTISTAEFFDGIFIDYNSADNTLTRNYVEACKDSGIRTRGYNNKITNNHVYAISAAGGGAGVGIYTETSADHDISQNYIENCAAEGVVIAGGASDLSTLAATISGNVFRNIDTGDTSNGVIEISGSDVSSLSVYGNVVRRDASTAYATPYFVYFDGITPTLQKIYGNSWQSGLIATAESNLDSAFLASDDASVYKTGGTDVAIADGGTGASTASAAFTALKQAATTSATGVVELATDAEVRSAATGVVVLASQIESASAAVALTDAATVAVNWDSGVNFTVTLTANRIIGNPTNGQPGTWRTILVQGDDATDRTITFDSQYLGDVPTITDCDSTRWYLLMIYCVSTSHFVVSAKRAFGS